MSAHRPLLISVMQFEDDLASGKRTVFDVIALARRFSVDGIELRRETWPNLDEEVAAARLQLADLGLMVTYATHAVLFAQDADGLRTLRNDIDTAQALGAPQLRVFSGPIPDVEDDTRWAVAREHIDYAAERDVVIALENYARTPGGKLAEIRGILDRLQTPTLMTNVDIGNYWLHGEDVPTAIRIIGDRAVSVHLKDQMAEPGQPPVLLGEGVLPLDAIFVELDRLPQRLFYCFEFRGGVDPEGHIQAAIAYMAQRRSMNGHTR
jgi:sugar phosphate isomerase/epimerase